MRILLLMHFLDMDVQYVLGVEVTFTKIARKMHFVDMLFETRRQRELSVTKLAFIDDLMGSVPMLIESILAGELPCTVGTSDYCHNGLRVIS